MQRYLSIISILALFLGLAAQAEEGRFAVYIHDFDPPLLAQKQGALKARADLKLSTILLLPTIKVKHGEKNGATLAQRLEMLRESVSGDARFIVPTLKEVTELEAQFNGDEKAIWEFLTKKYKPVDSPKNDIVFFLDRESPEFLRENPNATLTSFNKRHVYFRPKDAGTKVPSALFGNRSLKIGVPKNAFNSSAVRSEPLLDDIQVSEQVAKYMREKGVYGASEKLASFHSLPKHLVRQLQYEQLLNDRIENLVEFASINENTLPFKYYPESRPVFRLWNVDVPEEKVRILATGKIPENLIYVEIEGKRFVRFFIHPKSRELFSEVLKDYEWRQDFLATPTSSHRSLIAWDPKAPEKAFGVKTSLDAIIGQSRRILSKEQVERASAVSALVNSLDKETLAKEGILFIDEPVGVLVNGKEMGYAVRELVAPVSSAHEFIPVFSLYSTPADGVPPIHTMLEKSGLSAREFTEKFLIEPMVRQYSYLSFVEGMVGEPHEQNLLMELKDGQPNGRYYYRDLAGFHIKPDVRRAAGKTMDFMPAGIADSSMRFERANAIDNAITYLHKSNFYALHHALSKKYPEITKEWVEQTFEKHMDLSMQRFAGAEPKGRKFWRTNYKDFLNTGCGPAFQHL